MANTENGRQVEVSDGLDDLDHGYSGGSNLGTWDVVAVVGYFIVILVVSSLSMLRKNRNSVSGFFLAGRHMTWLPVGFSLFASNIGSEHFIGLSGSGAASGIAVGAFEFNALVLLQLLGFGFLPVYVASKVCTLPEYMKKRFGGDRIRIYLAVLSMVLYIFTKISVNLYSGAIFIQQALHWNLYLSVFALLALTCICTIGGGLAAVIYIDVVQVIIMVAGSSVLLFRGLAEVGGWSALQEKYLQAIPTEIRVNPFTNATCGVPGSDSWQILRAPTGSDMPWPGFFFGQTPASIWYWCADQMMVQKALSAKSLSHAQGATILTGWIKVLPLFLIVVPGMISRVLYPNEVGCVDPEICQQVCQNPVGCSNIAFPKLVLGIMPEGLRGIMISVMLAALMSDLTSIFNSASTLFTLDIYRKFRSSANSKELLLVGRIMILVLVAISIGWIPLIQEMQGGQMYVYIQSVAAYISPPIAMTFCMAMTWPRMNEMGAFWGLMTGLLMGVIRMILDFSFPAPHCVEEDTRPWIVAKVHYMYFAAFSFWMTGLAALVISLIFPADPSFRLIRTTIRSKNSQEQRPDEAMKKASDMAELERLNMIPTSDEDMFKITKGVCEVSSSHKSISSRCLKCICPEDEAQSQSQQDEEPSDGDTSLADLSQTLFQKVILYTNLVLIVSGAVVFYVLLSINPFTMEEIQEIQAGILRNLTSSPSPPK